jgi:hypothetical protein
VGDSFKKKCKDAGTCVQCNGSREDLRTLCSSCRMKDLESRNALRSARLCMQRCGAPAVSGKTLCQPCSVRVLWRVSKVHAKKRGHAPIAMSLAEFVLWHTEHLKSAAGMCEWCGEPFGPKGHVVEHDHTTGALRGLVCHPCNVIEGHLRSRDHGEKLLAKLYPR